MAAVTVELEAIEHLIDSLRPKDKLKLLKEIEHRYWKEQFNEVTTNIRRRISGKSIGDKEIDQICKEVRKECYAKNKSHH